MTSLPGSARPAPVLVKTRGLGGRGGAGQALRVWDSLVLGATEGLAISHTLGGTVGLVLLGRKLVGASLVGATSRLTIGQALGRAVGLLLEVLGERSPVGTCREVIGLGGLVPSLGATPGFGGVLEEGPGPPPTSEVGLPSHPL